MPHAEPHDEPLPEPEDDDVGEEEVAAEEEEDAINFDPRVEARDDWADAMSEVRKRKQQRSREARSDKGEGDDDNGDEPSWDKQHERQPLCSPRVFRRCIIMLAVLVLFGCVQLWMWLNPTPLSCDLELIRPQKFKVDVTDFFAPKVSAALQLVLNVRNNNMLRSMLLEQCTLVAYEAATSLKLGSAQQGSLVIAPFTTTRATISLQQLGGSLPQPEQRRLATEFLSKKALLLTIVATASSRLPFKGSKASTVATNSSKRVDLSTLTKEPFFQRQQASVEEEAPTSEPKVHDVPNV